MLFLRCPSPSHPPLPKLPRLISASDGAFATASPVAAHIPRGGFDSSILSEAARSLLEPVEPRFRVGDDGFEPKVGEVGEPDMEEEVSRLGPPDVAGSGGLVVAIMMVPREFSFAII